ncbi:MAG TPA: cytochrome c [Polyangia bacterium]|jgi:mono/diheme cytochrome c family protein
MRSSLLRLLSFAAMVAGCAGKQTPADRISSPGEALFNGRVKPDVDCYMCHNGDGTGTLRGPDLAKRVPKLTDQQIVEAILEGPSLMPSFRGKVDDADMKAITRWLRERFPRREADRPRATP